MIWDLKLRMRKFEEIGGNSKSWFQYPNRMIIRGNMNNIYKILTVNTN